MLKDKDDIKFDAHIRNEYANHGVTPPANLWLAIDSKASKLETLQLKRGAIFYKRFGLSVFTLLLVVSALYFYEISKGKEQSRLNNELSENQNFTNKTASKKKPSTSLLTKNKTLTKNENSSLTKTIPLLENTSSIKVNRLKETQKISQPIVKQKDRKEKKENKQKETKREKLTSPKKKKSVVSALKQKGIIANVEQKNVKRALNQVNKNVTINNKQQNLPVVKSSNLTELLIKQKKESFASNDIDLVIPLQPDFTSLSNLNTSKTTNNKTNFPPVTIIPAKILSRISASLFISPTYSSRFLKGNSATFYNKNQSGNLVYNAGLTIGYNIADNWIIRLGANYKQLKQAFDLTNKHLQDLPMNIDTNEKTITILSSLGTIKTEDLEELELDNDNEDVFDFREIQNFEFINIPIFVEYELGRKKLRFIFQIGGEANITIKSYSKIKISNTSNSNTIGVEDFAKTKTFNFSGTFGIGAKYLLSKRISVIVIPTNSLFLTNLNLDNLNKINPYFFSLSTGLQYRF